MFKKTTVCPNPTMENKGTCKGVREGGILRNACAACAAYKKYVNQTIPSGK